MNFRNMEEFWPFYVNQHSKPATRRWHFAGTLSSILCLIYAVLFNWWFLLFVPLLGYGMAWYSHFYVEGNMPATFGHPVWSLLCDYKMFGLMLTGQMDREIKRLASFNWWFVPLVGYGMAWYSHFYVEGNKPATFGHPVWSLLCDYKMFGLMLTGQMDREIKRLGIRHGMQLN